MHPYHQGYKTNWHYRRKQQVDYTKVALFIIILGLVVTQFLLVANNPAAY